MSSQWGYAWRELSRRKGRTFANIIGYLLAVALMIVLVNVLLYAKGNSDAVLNSTGTHFIVYLPECCPESPPNPLQEGLVVWGGVPTRLLDEDTLLAREAKPSSTPRLPANDPRRSEQLTTAKMAMDIASLSVVRAASPFLMFRMRDPTDQHLFTLGGYDPNIPEAYTGNMCSPSDIVEGKFLDAGDSRKVMLDQAYAVNQGLQVGDIITLQGEPFQIVGVVTPPIRPTRSDIYLHFEDAQRIISRYNPDLLSKDNANIIIVEVASATRQKEAFAKVKAMMPAKSIISTFGCYKPAAAAMGISESSVWMLTLLLGFSAVAMALKSQLATVIERRRDIGILKAIGWSNGDVVSQLMAESVILSIIGAAAGCLAAVGILLIVPAARLSGPETSGFVTLVPWVFAAAFGLALLGGLIAGLVPGWNAARQSPADALRRI